MNSQEVAIESKSQDPVIEQLVAELRRRSEFGLKKYGVPLSREDLTLKDWLKLALEETLDKAGYLQCAINNLEAVPRPADSDPLKEPIPDASQRFLALMYGMKI